jgi:hypothetical protein
MYCILSYQNMTSEVTEKRCRDCVFGKQLPGRELNLGIPSRIPLGIMITPKIRRECLNTLDTVLLKRDRVVGMSAKCIKLKSYTIRV